MIYYVLGKVQLIKRLAQRDKKIRDMIESTRDLLTRLDNAEAAKHSLTKENIELLKKLNEKDNENN